jgi:hypothetical protein
MDDSELVGNWIALTGLAVRFITGFMAETSGTTETLTPAEEAAIHQALLAALQRCAETLLLQRSKVEVAQVMDYDGLAWRYRLHGGKQWEPGRYTTRDDAMQAARERLKGT